MKDKTDKKFPEKTKERRFLDLVEEAKKSLMEIYSLNKEGRRLLEEFEFKIRWKMFYEWKDI